MRMMELYVIDNHEDIYPGLSGSQLTDRLIMDCLTEHGIFGAEIGRSDNGKPYVFFSEESKELHGNCELPHISVSHSGKTFACLVADRPVGVDIQLEREASIDKIVKRYFSPAERAYVQAHGDAGFFVLWTRKEAYSKYIGTGLAEIVKGTEVLCRDDVAFSDFLLGDGMYCCCCMEREQKEGKDRK